MRFDRQWFEKHQAPLVRFVNSRLGRWFFKLDKVELPKDARIMEVGTGHCSYDWKFVPDKEGKLVLQKTAMFFTSNRFQRRLEYVYSKAAAVVGSMAAFKLMEPVGALGFLPMVALTTTTFYPDANVESTSVDGMCENNPASAQSWATLHDATDGTNADDTSTNQLCCLLNAWDTSNTFGDMVRGYFLFDISAIGAGATISSATESIRGTGKNDNATMNQAVGITGCTPASNTAITTADFDQVQGTRFANDIDLGSISASAYNDFAFIAAGLTAVDNAKTGVLKTSVRFNSDIDNTPPTWAAFAYSDFSCYYAEQGGADHTNDPKLVVTYTVSTAWQQVCADTMTSTASIAKKATRTLSETLVATASILKGPTRTLANTITATASITTLRSILKTLSDTITATASVAKTATHVLSNTITATASRVAATTRTLANTITTTASVTTLRTAVKILLDTIVTTTSRVVSVVRTLANTITATASVNKGPNRVVSDTATTTASVTKAPTKVLSNTITATALLTKLLNGASTIWTAASKATASWAASAKSAASWINGNKSS